MQSLRRSAYKCSFASVSLFRSSQSCSSLRGRLEEQSEVLNGKLVFRSCTCPISHADKFPIRTTSKTKTPTKERNILKPFLSSATLPTYQCNRTISHQYPLGGPQHPNCFILFSKISVISLSVSTDWPWNTIAKRSASLIPFLPA